MSSGRRVFQQDVLVGCSVAHRQCGRGPHRWDSKPRCGEPGAGSFLIGIVAGAAQDQIEWSGAAQERRQGARGAVRRYGLTIAEHKMDVIDV